MISFKLLTPPALEPVTLAEAKLQARIDTTAEDSLVTSLITGARQWAEQYTGRALITQTWQMAMDAWPSVRGAWWDGVREGPITGYDIVSAIKLPHPPLISVTNIQTFAADNSATVFPASNYYVDTLGTPGRVALQSGAVWPSPTRPTNGILIEYIAGYGSSASAVPEPIKTAIRQITAHWYENRGEATTAPTARGNVTVPSVPVPLVIQALLDPYRVRSLGG